MMFSVLSQGYGTYDGTAKKDVQEISDTKVSLNIPMRVPIMRCSHVAIYRVLL